MPTTSGNAGLIGSRFRVERELGRGGLGVVFQVGDLERGGVVALKMLHQRDSQALFELKREFRGLAGVHHPNLVTLYELFVDGDRPWGQCETELYAGDPAAAAAVLSDRRKQLKRSLLLHMALIRCEYRHLEGRVDLALAAGEPDPAARDRLLARVRKRARALARESLPLAQMFGALLAAGIAAVSDRADEAERLLREVVARLDETGTRLFAAAARRQLGVILGGDDGDALVRQADAWMAEEGISQPARMAAMLVPGWSGRNGR